MSSFTACRIAPTCSPCIERERYGLDYEGVIREEIVLVLTYPKFSYRIDIVQARGGIQPLSDFDLARRLSYLPWSSMPDNELLQHAAAGDLRDPEVIKAQARRTLQDPHVRALAVEFGGQLAGRCSRSRFTSSWKCFLDARDTFVNPILTRHYGVPSGRESAWIDIPAADRYGRGGLLPIAGF